MEENPHFIKNSLRMELEAIYKEKSSWDGGKGPFTPSAIRRRELILMEEQAIYALERAIEEKDEVKEMLFQEILFVIKKYLEEIPLEGKDG